MGQNLHANMEFSESHILWRKTDEYLITFYALFFGLANDAIFPEEVGHVFSPFS